MADEHGIEAMSEATEQTRTPHRKRLTGLVRSISGAKTINVTVETLVRDERYGKFLRKRKHYAVHDPKQAAHVGDLVEIAECRPISKTKNWQFVRVVREDPLARVAAGEKE